LICCKTIIGKGSPNKAGSHEAHGSPLGEKEVAATRVNIGWNYPPFEIPADVYAGWDAKVKGATLEKEWDTKFAAYTKAFPTEAAEFTRRMAGDLPRNWRADADALVAKVNAKAETIASRKASQNAIEALAACLPELVGGSADLASSNLTLWPAAKGVHKVGGGNYVYYGVREFGMSAIMNGLTLHGGVIPYGGTFLTFSDYSRNALRMAALMKIPSIFVYTHDSVFLGEDGPTHQSVEQLFSLRLIPNMTLFRPADGVETAMAWAWAIGNKHDGPTVIVLTRQKVDIIPHGATFDAHEVWRGAYVLDGYADGDFTFIATGSEVTLAVRTAELLRKEGIRSRVVSAPSLDVFDRQPADYQNEVLGDRSRVVAIEAGRSSGWYKYVNHDALVVGIDRFGASAPLAQIEEHFGFTPEQVAERIREWRTPV